MLFELVVINRTARTKWFGLCKRLRAKNDTGRFDEERKRLVWISANYEVDRNNLSISGLNAFFE